MEKRWVAQGKHSQRVRFRRPCGSPGTIQTRKPLNASSVAPWEVEAPSLLQVSLLPLRYIPSYFSFLIQLFWKGKKKIGIYSQEQPLTRKPKREFRSRFLLKSTDQLWGFLPHCRRLLFCLFFFFFPTVCWHFFLTSVLTNG